MMFRSDDEVSRRTFLKAGAVAATALGMVGLPGGTAEAFDRSHTAAEPVHAAPLEQGMTVVDSHCHATPIWYGDIDALLFEMDRNDVQHAMLVQIGGFFDNEYQFNFTFRHLKRPPSRLRGSQECPKRARWAMDGDVGPTSLSGGGR